MRTILIGAAFALALSLTLAGASQARVYNSGHQASHSKSTSRGWSAALANRAAKGPIQLTRPANRPK